jgi:hypothetical protein
LKNERRSWWNLYQDASVRRDAQCAGGDDVDVGLGQFSGRGWRLTVQVDGNGMIVFHERHRERERERGIRVAVGL